MFTLIISTAQQARPNVIHQREPVRAHWNNSSVEVTRKPLSVTSDERSSKKARSGCVHSAGKGTSVSGLSITPNRAPPSSIHQIDRAQARKRSQARRVGNKYMKPI